MHSLRSVILCATAFLHDLHCAMFYMHLVFACTAAWNEDQQTCSGDVIPCVPAEQDFRALC